MMKPKKLTKVKATVDQASNTYLGFSFAANLNGVELIITAATFGEVVQAFNKICPNAGDIDLTQVYRTAIFAEMDIAWKELA